MKGLTRLGILACGALALGPRAGIASQQSPAGMRFEAAFTADGFSNLRGGRTRGARFLDNMDVTLTADLETLLGWEGTTLFVYGLGNQGRSPSELIGDAQVVSNIDAPNSWRIYEAWIETALSGGVVSLKAGLYDLNSEFSAVDVAGVFLNSSHGIGPDFSQTGLNGPSIFPITSLGIRARAEVSQGLTVQAVILDGVPGDPDDLTGTRISLSREDGALIVAEVGYRLAEGFGGLPGGLRVALGAYRYTRELEGIPSMDAAVPAESYSGSGGGYFLAEGELFTESGQEGQGAAAYVRGGLADSRVNRFGSFLGAGVVYTGALPNRGEDQLGLGVAVANNGGRFRRFSALSGAPVWGEEVAFELTYQASLLRGILLQPDLQYIVHPGTEKGLGDALALGLRVGMAF